MRFALLRGVIGSLCLTVTSFWIAAFVEPVPGRALMRHVIPLVFSHRLTFGGRPQPYLLAVLVVFFCC